MAITIVGPKSITLPSALGGDDSIYGLVVVCATRGIFVTDSGEDQVRLHGITDRSLLTIDLVKLLFSKGCDILGYYAVFEIDDPTAEVPAEFPNRTFETLSDPEDPESGTTTNVHTWKTWGANEGDTAKDLPVQVNGTWYRTSRDRNDGGNYIPASAWVPASLAGLVVLESIPVAAE